MAARRVLDKRHKEKAWALVTGKGKAKEKRSIGDANLTQRDSTQPQGRSLKSP